MENMIDKIESIRRSSDRELFGVSIGYSDNGFISLSDLSTAYNKSVCQSKLTKRDIYDITDTEYFKIQLYDVLFLKKIIDVPKEIYLIDINKIGIIKYLKKTNYGKQLAQGQLRVYYA